MSYLSQVTTEPPHKGLRMIIYGPPKIGKSTFGAQIPGHIFLNTEDGLSYIKGAVHLPSPLRDYTGFKNMLTELATTEHKYKTIIVDTLDKVEDFMGNDIAAAQNNASIKCISDIAYGKGFPVLINETHKLQQMLDYLAIEKKMNVILICHDEIKKVQPPIGNEYTYHAPSLFSKTSAGDNTLKIWSDWADIIAYCDFRTIVKQVDKGFNQKTGQALGTGERVMFMDAANPAYVAGSRVPGMPLELPFTWPDFVAAFMNARKSSKPDTTEKIANEQ